VEDEMPEAMRENVDEWEWCAARALERDTFLTKLTTAGFEGLQMQSEPLSRLGDETNENGWDSGQILSAVILAKRPERHDQRDLAGLPTGLGDHRDLRRPDRL
jgi:hypothetical protein